MKLSRNHIIIISVVVIIIIAYFLFFRKKPAPATAPAPSPKKEGSESNYSAIPGTEPFNKTFMKPVSTANATASVMDQV